MESPQLIAQNKPRPFLNASAIPNEPPIPGWTEMKKDMPQELFNAFLQALLWDKKAPRFFPVESSSPGGVSSEIHFPTRKNTTAPCN